MPQMTKTAVATIERGDSRPTPQMPWPLVQPLPNRVPIPTRNPASKITGEKGNDSNGIWAK